MGPSSELYEELSKSFGNDELHDDRKYIPVHVLNKDVTKDSIKAELGRKTRSCVSFNGCLAEKVVKRNARKVFTILLLIERPLDIKELLDGGLTDEDLPITKDRKELWSARNPSESLKLCEEWGSQTIELFLTRQWMVLAHIFTTSRKHLTLHAQCPLPFSELEEISATTGGVVYKAKIEASHQQWFAGETPSHNIVIKEFKILKQKDQFEQERENLQMVRDLINNKHITQNLATFSQGKNSYIIFPLAEGGNLDDFWRNRNSKSRTPHLALWCLRQMLGLTEALQALHHEIGEKKNCRHGDLKPENILHFLTEGEGILKITDFGISRIHQNATLGREGNATITRATTPSYEAPEATLPPSENVPRSRKYDIWSIGCIFLEFTIWLVQDWDTIEKFTTARDNSGNRKHAYFYQMTNGAAEVHSEVIRKIEILKEIPQCRDGTALADLLDVIESKALVVDVERRHDAEKLCTELQGIVRKAELDPLYLFSNRVSAAVD